MALQVSCSIYGTNQGDWTNPAGITRGFPTQGILIEAVSPAVSVQGVACNSLISVLPTGLNQITIKYYTDKATATLITAANA